MLRVDLNADLGESSGSLTMGDDDALLGIVTSANIACGFHAGDPAVLLRTCRVAAERGVSIGAHVSYPDLKGFGRRFMNLSADELYAVVLYQLGAISGVARMVGAPVRYVKPHGALYNTIVHHEEQAGAVVQAVGDVDPQLALLGMAGSVAATLASRAGLITVNEAFADRAYNADGTLVARDQPGAVLHDPDQITERMLLLVRSGELEAVDGSMIAVSADSICVHGDTPGAVEVARRLRSALADAGVELRAFS